VRVPVLDLLRQYATLQDDIDAAMRRVLATGRFILGTEVEALEQEIAERCGVAHGIGVASGTDALLLSLRALDIGPDDRVIVPAFTFFATAGVVHRLGATPVFADIDRGSFNVDPEHVDHLLETLPGRPPRVILPVHLFGQMADLPSLASIAERHGALLVEDAAQALGAACRGSPAGSVGKLGCFSFYPTKNLGAYGDGGMLVTDDADVADRVRQLRMHGARPKYVHHEVGMNSRLDELQAAILRVKLGHLDAWIAARQQRAATYDARLSGLHGIACPPRREGFAHVFHQYTVRVLGGHRDRVRDGLATRGIGSMVYYPLPLHLQPCFAHLGYRQGQLPESERACREVLSLPLFPELREDEQAQVVDAVRGAVSAGDAGRSPGDA